MPTLLQISLSVSNHSVGGIAKSIGHCAIENGWNSYITYTDRILKTDCDSTLIKIGSNFDYFLHFLLTRFTDLHGLGSYFSTKKLIRKIEEINPDIIQIHNLHGYYLNYKLLFKYLNRVDIPVVWTFHDCWSFTGHCSHFVTVNCEKWKVNCNNCPLTRNYPKSFVDNSSYNYRLKKKIFTGNKNLHIITVSQWLADFVKESFLKAKDIRVIHNGIDINAFNYNMIKSKKTFTILGVSRIWNKNKGLYDLYKLRNLLDENYKIIIVGLTAEQVKDLPEGIEGITRTRDLNELMNLYKNANVLVNPTYADSFPTVNLEALACGTPVITYRTGGSPEAVDENTGIVVEQGNINGIIEAINTIRNTKDKYTPFLCRKRAEVLFDKDICFKKYIEFYKTLLNC